MKKLFSIMLCIGVLVAMTACQKDSEKSTKASDKRVLDAIEVLQEHWSGLYDRGEGTDDRYLEIVNTTIINIKETPDFDKYPKQKEAFENIDYIVEFELRSNYMGTSPYYSNTLNNSCVVVYEDGTKKVSEYNLINAYRAATYSTDYSNFIESIEEFHGDYDRILEIE